MSTIQNIIIFSCFVDFVTIIVIQLFECTVKLLELQNHNLKCDTLERNGKKLNEQKNIYKFVSVTIWICRNEFLKANTVL